MGRASSSKNRRRKANLLGTAWLKMEVRAKIRSRQYERERGVSRMVPESIARGSENQVAWTDEHRLVAIRAESHEDGDKERRESDRRRESLARRHLLGTLKAKHV